MLDKLTDLVPELELSCDSELIQQADISQELAKTRYPLLSKLPITKKINLGVKLSEYHIQLKNQFDDELRENLIEKLSTITPSSENSINEIYVTTLLAKFQEILTSIGLSLTVTTLPTSSKILVGMRISTSPNIVEIGLGSTTTQAELNAILKLIDNLTLRLK